MEEQESIWYVIMVAIVMFLIPGTGNDQMAQLLVLIALGLGAIAVVLIALTQIPALRTIAPVPDDITKFLAWASVIVAMVVIILMQLLDFIG
ncbi:MAG: hypothetical protein ACFFD4_08715 [Candidatus Odinarchaeota archaeon]